MFLFESRTKRDIGKCFNLSENQKLFKTLAASLALKSVIKQAGPHLLFNLPIYG